MRDDASFQPIPNGIAGYEAVVGRTYFPMKIAPLGAQGSFGSEVVSHTIGPIVITRIRATGRYHGQPCRPETSPDRPGGIVLNLSEEGGLLFEGAGNAVTTSGDFILMNPERRFEVLQEGTAQSLAILIPRPLLARHWDHVEELCFVPVPSQDGTARLLREMLRCTWDLRLTFRSAVVHELVDSLMHLVSATFRGANGSARVASVSLQAHYLRIRAYVAEHLAEEDLSAGVVCDALGLSNSHMYAVMSAANTTLRRFILEQRLERARQLLEFPATRSRSISQIAFCVGFREHSHFSRRFGERFGVSPKSYRTQCLRRSL